MTVLFHFNFLFSAKRIIGVFFYIAWLKFSRMFRKTQPVIALWIIVIVNHPAATNRTLSWYLSLSLTLFLCRFNFFFRTLTCELVACHIWQHARLRIVAVTCASFPHDLVEDARKILRNERSEDSLGHSCARMYVCTRDLVARGDRGWCLRRINRRPSTWIGNFLVTCESTLGIRRRSPDLCCRCCCWFLSRPRVGQRARTSSDH